MNEMKNFFNTASTDTIGECLSGEKLLNASRDAKGNTLLTFESSYEGYSDLLTIMPDGSVIGTFICDEEQRPQTESAVLSMRFKIRRHHVQHGVIKVKYGKAGLIASYSA